MSPGVFRWLLAGELVLGAMGVVWAALSHDFPSYAFGRSTVVLALGLTLALVVVNFWLFSVARRFRFTREVYRFFEEEIFPVVRGAGLPELVLAAAAAGFAEELLFRGILQPRIGLVASSLVFGFLHGPGRSLWPFALWAAVIGAVFGIVFRWTGSLAAPTAAHAVYDAVALVYIRYWTSSTSPFEAAPERHP